MDYRQMTAPCGIDCFNCPMVAARDDNKLRGLIAKNMNLSFEDAMCNGCRNQDGKCSCAFPDRTVQRLSMRHG